MKKRHGAEQIVAMLRQADVALGNSTKGKLTFWRGITSVFIQFGAIAGMFCFGYVALRIGRKPTFGIALVAAASSTATVFWFFDDFSQVYLMIRRWAFANYRCLRVMLCFFRNCFLLATQYRHKLLL